jgi:hypothetical protein
VFRFVPLRWSIPSFVQLLHPLLPLSCELHLVAKKCVMVLKFWSFCNYSSFDLWQALLEPGCAHTQYFKNWKMLFKSFKKYWNNFLHLHIMLILTHVSFYGNIQLYVAYTKITKYPNDTIMFGFILFTRIWTSILSFYVGRIQSYFFVKTYTSIFM